MKRHPLVSIIVVNWNGGTVFKNCLRSLKKIHYQNWELIVVDNGSSDGSDRLPKSLQFAIGNYQLIRNKSNLGFASANNQGYKKSKGKYILLLNNDTKVKSDFLLKLVKRMEKDKTLGVVQPKIYLMDKPDYLDNAGSFPTKIGFFYHWGFLKKDSKEFSKEKLIFSAKGACMLIRRDLIEEVGFFDPDFFSYFEETDFCWRVWLAGFTVLFYPGTAIYHKVGFTIKRLDVTEINFHYYKNRITSLIKNMEARNLIYILPLHLLISWGIVVIFLLKMQPNNSLMILKAMYWNLINIKSILQKRAKIQLLRKVEDRYIFQKLMRPVQWKQYLADFRRIEQDIKENTSQ